ncbi:CCA tRNA nucleotidyltransferase [Enterovirga sp.]|uniref:CCA tRNA nucleotidyltransferase n=1 Tax=Enterovirga sp. TaxID=2026350 RepID=UPI002609FE5C|nr:CCA tRNA nucleotidyltransferase [Enterovirga sp.]MDB5592207.1 tRNA nucleotidyltransferase [Enterovirga sp.]
MSLDREAARALSSRPDVARLLAVLDGDGEETRIVGGAVRNVLIGRPVRDIDLATTALPAEVAARAERAGCRTVPTGIQHGTVTVIANGRPFEVTTLREDVETDGRHAVVRFGRDFAADAERRDFTVNALTLRRDGTVQDTVGGLADLAAGRVRFIGEAARRIREDYLRALRFFRFWAEYGRGPLDAAGYEAVIGARDGLARLSRERIRTELLKLLAAPRAVEALALLETGGLLGRLVARVCDLGRLGRAAACEADAVGRLAACLVRSPEDAGGLREALRLSNEEFARLERYAAALARLVARTEPLDEAELRRQAVLNGAEALKDVAAATLGEPRPVLTAEAARLLARYRAGEAQPPRFPLTGADLVAAGLAPGREIGRRLAEAREAWLAAGCPERWSWAGG